MPRGSAVRVPRPGPTRASSARELSLRCSTTVAWPSGFGVACPCRSDSAYSGSAKAPSAVDRRMSSASSSPWAARAAASWSRVVSRAMASESNMRAVRSRHGPPLAQKVAWRVRRGLSSRRRAASGSAREMSPASVRRTRAGESVANNGVIRWSTQRAAAASRPAEFTSPITSSARRQRTQPACTASQRRGCR